MRVLFTASRSYTDRDTAWAVLDIIAAQAAAIPGEELVVVHGACFPRDDEGRHVMASDYIAELWTRRDDHPLPVRPERHPPKYSTYGKQATWVRNGEMVRSGIDVCLSFEAPDSKGAKGTADMAEREEIAVRRFYAGEASEVA
jgi:hypothetical protein